MSRHEEQICPRCSAPFECRVGSVLICECSTVELSDAQRGYIRDLYSGCLCIACLRDISKMCPAGTVPSCDS